MDENITDLFPFYALGVLTETEKEQVNQYIKLHPEARHQLEAETTAVSALAYSATPVPPPPRLKRGLMNRIQADAAQRNLTSPQSRFFDRFRLASMMPTLAGLSLVIAVIAGVWIFLLGREVSQLQEKIVILDHTITASQVDVAPLQREVETLRQENATLQQELSEQQEKFVTLATQFNSLEEENRRLTSDLSAQSDALSTIRDDLSERPAPSEDLIEFENQLSAQSQLISDQDEAIAALQEELTQLRDTNAMLLKEVTAQREIMVYVTSPNVQPMLIAGTTALPSARGQLIANPNDATGALIISGLPPLAPGLVYQFWLVHQTEGYIQAGIVDVDEEGVGTLIVNPNTQIGDFDAMGISIEAVDKTPEPTRESMIMLGALSS